MYHNYQLDTSRASDDLDTLASHIDTEGSLQEDDNARDALRQLAAALAQLRQALDHIVATAS